MKISIVVPCYNCEETLEMCVQSLTNQTYGDFEIILVDDGSTDATGILCDRLMEKNQRIQVIHQKNMGLMAAWKRGVAQASGEYVIFVDSDDWIERDLLEKLQEIINNTGVDVISYGIMLDYSDGRSACRDNHIREGYYDKAAIEKEIWPFYFGIDRMGTMAILPSRCNKAVKKELLIKNINMLKDSLSIGEDDVTSFMLILDADSLYNVKEYYAYHYCRRAGSMLNIYNTDTMKKFIDVRNELLVIAENKEYPYEWQVYLNFLENILMVIKKTIVDMGYQTSDIKKYLQEMLEIEDVQAILKNKNISHRVGKQEKAFVFLLSKKRIVTCIVLTKIAAKIRTLRLRKEKDGRRA